MEQYTVYCTEEQTERAFELGAPINYYGIFVDDDNVMKLNGAVYRIPTVDQMRKWLLKEKGLLIEVRSDGSKFVWCLREFPSDKSFIQALVTNSDDEAFAAAIDAALDYLEKGGSNAD